MTRASAPAKINLALVVGPGNASGKHEVATVYQRIDLADEVMLEPSTELRVTGFEGDTLVARALREIAAAAGVEPCWHAHIEKSIPVAAGLGGGSSDAATTLRLANDSLERPLPPQVLHRIAADIGADVPFFLEQGPRLGTGDGSETRSIDLPLDYTVVLLAPEGATKPSTASVYAEFDRRRGEQGFQERRDTLLVALRSIRAATDLAALPGNDLAASQHAADLTRLGAFRADVTGAGPTVYGLFERIEGADHAARALAHLGATWVCNPAW